MLSNKIKQQMYKLHAEYCKALANPRRLEILDLLRSGELKLEKLRGKMKIQRPALSQHLAILKERGFISTKKAGREIYCRVVQPKILRACDIFQEVLFEDIDKKKKLQKNLTSKIRKKSL